MPGIISRICSPSHARIIDTLAKTARSVVPANSPYRICPGYGVARNDNIGCSVTGRARAPLEYQAICIHIKSISMLHLRTNSATRGSIISGPARATFSAAPAWIIQGRRKPREIKIFGKGVIDSRPGLRYARAHKLAQSRGRAGEFQAYKFEYRAPVGGGAYEWDGVSGKKDAPPDAGFLLARNPDSISRARRRWRRSNRLSTADALIRRIWTEGGRGQAGRVGRA